MLLAVGAGHAGGGGGLGDADVDGLGGSIHPPSGLRCGPGAGRCTATRPLRSRPVSGRLRRSDPSLRSRSGRPRTACAPGRRRRSRRGRLFRCCSVLRGSSNGCYRVGWIGGHNVDAAVEECSGQGATWSDDGGHPVGGSDDGEAGGFDLDFHQVAPDSPSNYFADGSAASFGICVQAFTPPP